MPDTLPPQPPKKRSLFGRIMAGSLLLVFLAVAVLVFLAWRALQHPGTPPASASDPNSGSVEIWQPNGSGSGGQVYTPPAGTGAADASDAPADDASEPERGSDNPTPPRRERPPAADDAGVPLEPVQPAEVPIRPVNPPSGETEIKPVNPPPQQQAPRQPPRRQQQESGGNDNPVDNLF